MLFFTIILPMMWEKQDASHSTVGWLLMVGHVSFVMFIVANVLFNYALCVATRHKGPKYDQVVRELAAATNFVFPETPEQVAIYKREYEDRMVLRMRRRQARYQQAMHLQQQQQQQQQQQEAESQQQKPKQIQKDPLASQAHKSQSTEESSSNNNNNNNNGVTQRRAAVAAASSTATNDSSTTTDSAPSQPKPTPTPTPTPAPTPPFPIRRWMLMGPFEWGYCGNSNQPKPPRSHFDHVSKTLVLNLDHYCPWMFNASKFVPPRAVDDD